MDAALLAAACGAVDGARVLEAGCGAGAALLSAAVRSPRARFVGLERDTGAAALARRNVEANGLASRVEIHDGDVGAPPATLALGGFDAAMANPPFFDDPDALRAPSPARRGAWIADDGLDAWIDFLLAAVRPGGAIVLIHRADRLGDILAGLGRGAGSMAARAVHPFADAAAKRVLVRAVKGGRAPLRLVAPLVLHPREGGKHTPQADAVLRGDAGLEWD